MTKLNKIKHPSQKTIGIPLSKRSLLWISLLFLSFSFGCKKYFFRANYSKANKVLHDTKNLKEKPFLKAHLKNGDVCILHDSWKIDTIANLLSGNGTRYDYQRSTAVDNNFSLPFDSILLFETNISIKGAEAGRLATLGVLAGFDVALGVFCISNPKSCFGSCPSFYLKPEDNFHFADAEGFSNAVAPSLAYGDIDALNNPRLNDSVFTLTMRNEALETHCIKDLKVLAVKRAEGERVYQSKDNQFYRCKNTYPISRATGAEGDVTSLLKDHDRVERFSKANSRNLKSKEEIILEFENIQQLENPGLVISFRQTLMTTYFVYSAIAYMGEEVTDYMAKMEKDKNIESKLIHGLKGELGDLDVYVWDETNSVWQQQGGIYETGPIAVNRQILPLQTAGKSSKLKVKLAMNKGLWRVDGITLTNILENVKPTELSPNLVLRKGKEDRNALLKIQSKDEHLVSMPGNEFTFTFNIPEAGQDYEMFLYSKGYYLEWMRTSWLKDKNKWKLYTMFQHPTRYLKSEAGNYAKYEKTMEQEFWNSRIDTKTFTHYEN